ncbi:MAG: hypothetical protein JRI23_02855 [Deltaproteobacteria bacterium]|nr:hypothetical protein [Deltaproteobacteria bacterium]MBW2530445.1 hypothetical protein [Deltaproteobacteria bacterium]
MSLRPRLTIALALAAALLTEPTLAAPGALLDPGALGADAEHDLRRRVRAAKRDDVHSFERLAAARRRVVWLDDHKRGPIAPVAPLLKAMGPRALLPMLERVALDAEPQGTLSSSAWLAWRLGLVEAVGALRDPRAEPVLLALVETPPAEPKLHRAAAVAFAKLSTRPVARRLIRHARRDAPARRIALAALGHCRVDEAARFLADELGNAPAGRDAPVLARALGDVGSDWAWQSPALASREDRLVVRATAARALVGSFATAGDRARRMITKAVLVVNHPDTPAMLRDAQREATPEGRAALDRLRQRFERSPLRR